MKLAVYSYRVCNKYSGIYFSFRTDILLHKFIYPGDDRRSTINTEVINSVDPGGINDRCRGDQCGAINTVDPGGGGGGRSTTDVEVINNQHRGDQQSMWRQLTWR